MKVRGTYTVIITRNFGRPVSLSISSWRLYGLLALGGVALFALLSFSGIGMLAYPRLQLLERENQELLRERDGLKEQLLSANQEVFSSKERPTVATARPGGTEQEPDLPDNALYSSEKAYLPPIKFSSVAMRIDRTTVELIFRISREGKAANNRGGFLFAIFENRDVEPAAFLPTPRVEINEDGFPEAYKTGIRVTRVRSDITIRRKIRRKSPDDYFTHVTLYLFSIRGGLIIRDRFELERELFLNPTRQINKLT